MCYSGRYTLREMKQKLNGKGGLAALLGTTDVADIAQRASQGEEPYSTVLRSMLYDIAKVIGERAVALRGKVDAIILTGGIAHNRYCTDTISQWVSWIAPVIVHAGEDELDSLAFNAYGAMTGSISVIEYNPE